MVKNHYPAIGTVSHGTMRPEDLLPAFLDALSECLEGEGTGMSPDSEYMDEMGRIEGRMDEPGYYESAECWDDLAWVEDSLNEHAPPFCFFGAHEGDGSDFGFWPCVEWTQDDELPRGGETPAEPTDSGFFLQVSDHGNMELYEWRGGAWHSVWGVV
jgi:hypothetical protein